MKRERERETMYNHLPKQSNSTITLQKKKGREVQKENRGLLKEGPEEVEGQTGEGSFRQVASLLGLSSVECWSRRQEAVPVMLPFLHPRRFPQVWRK